MRSQRQLLTGSKSRFCQTLQERQQILVFLEEAGSLYPAPRKLRQELPEPHQNRQFLLEWHGDCIQSHMKTPKLRSEFASDRNDGYWTERLRLTPFNCAEIAEKIVRLTSHPQRNLVREIQLSVRVLNGVLGPDGWILRGQTTYSFRSLT